MTDLVSKYNIQAPRYTSYPTVPYWDNTMNEAKWVQHIKNAFVKYNKEGISLYIHLPYCESLCTYCACNTRITVNHKVEVPYIESLLKEWQLYLNQFESKPLIKEIHLGGGTPTFFSPENLTHLLSSILKTVDVAKDYDFSFEGHPGNTTKAHLQALFNLGFKRVSFGIQDFDEKVQDTINRYQTFEEVDQVINDAREIGYTSINFDLVYGLPYQTVESINDTITKIISLKPERIAFYSYAHVPWLKPGQRKYSEKDLPADSYKRSLYEEGKKLFLLANYSDIGMDHFALPNDSLFDAFEKACTVTKEPHPLKESLIAEFLVEFCTFTAKCQILKSKALLDKIKDPSKYGIDFMQGLAQVRSKGYYVASFLLSMRHTLSL